MTIFKIKRWKLIILVFVIMIATGLHFAANTSIKPENNEETLVPHYIGNLQLMW